MPVRVMRDSRKRRSTKRTRALVPLQKSIAARFGTWREAASAIGCSLGHLHNVAHGKRIPSVRLLRRITDKTGLRIGLDAFG
jgi:transcriptional regulator with XRE-family HTH domain